MTDTSMWTTGTNSGGFTANVTINNNSSTTLNTWSLSWKWPSSQAVTASWNAAVTETNSGVVVAKNTTVDLGVSVPILIGQPIPANSSETFGLEGTWTNNNTVPTVFMLNGKQCAPPTTTTTTSPPTTTTTPPTTTTSPPTTTTQPSTTTTSANSSCSVSITPNTWSGGFTANVDITNTSASALSNWTLTWTWPASQVITNSWNAAITQTGEQVSASNETYNGSLAPGQSTTFGFQGTYSGASNTMPSSFDLNGSPCSS
jgi:hypothetical protein